MSVVVGVGLLLFGACGGDSDVGGGNDEGGEATAADGETQLYIDAVADEIADQGDIPMDDEMAACAAAAMVNLVGVDALVEAGISPEEFGDADSLSELDVEAPVDAAARLGEAFGECDFAVLLTAAMAEGFAEAAGTELPAEGTACLEDSMGGQAVTDALATFFVDGSPGDLRTVIGDALVAVPRYRRRSSSANRRPRRLPRPKPASSTSSGTIPT
jgi:hypothetical protein